MLTKRIRLVPAAFMVLSLVSVHAQAYDDASTCFTAPTSRYRSGRGCLMETAV